MYAYAEQKQSQKTGRVVQKRTAPESGAPECCNMNRAVMIQLQTYKEKNQMYTGFRDIIQQKSTPPQSDNGEGIIQFIRGAYRKSTFYGIATKTGLQGPHSVAHKFLDIYIENADDAKRLEIILYTSDALKSMKGEVTKAEYEAIKHQIEVYGNYFRRLEGVYSDGDSDEKKASDIARMGIGQKKMLSEFKISYTEFNLAVQNYMRFVHRRDSRADTERKTEIIEKLIKIGVQLINDLKALATLYIVNLNPYATYKWGKGETPPTRDELSGKGEVGINDTHVQDADKYTSVRELVDKRILDSGAITSFKDGGIDDGFADYLLMFFPSLTDFKYP